MSCAIHGGIGSGIGNRSGQSQCTSASETCFFGGQTVYVSAVNNGGREEGATACLVSFNISQSFFCGAHGESVCALWL